MPKAKLDEQKVREIRMAYPFATVSELATAHRVSRTTIYDIIKRRKWSWVRE
jgi:Mor family transcriptional regulator